MTISFITVMTVAMASPFLQPLITTLLNASYGALALIFLTSVSIAVSLSPTFSASISDELMTEYSVQSVDDYPVSTAHSFNGGSTSRK